MRRSMCRKHALCAACAAAAAAALCGCAAAPLEENTDKRPLSQKMKSGYNATLKINGDKARVSRVF